MFLRLFLFGSDVKCLEKSAAHSKGREKTKKEVKKEAEKRLGEKIWIQERYWKK